MILHYIEFYTKCINFAAPQRNSHSQIELDPVLPSLTGKPGGNLFCINSRSLANCLKGGATTSKMSNSLKFVLKWKTMFKIYGKPLLTWILSYIFQNVLLFSIVPTIMQYYLFYIVAKRIRERSNVICLRQSLFTFIVKMLRLRLTPQL